MRLESVKVNPALVDGGVWWDYESTRAPCVPATAPHATMFSVLVVPFGEAYQREIERLRQPHLDVIRANKGITPVDLDKRLRGEAMAKHVLKGWANLTKEDKDFPHSEASAEWLLNDGHWQLVRTFVEDAARTLVGALMNEEEAAKGN